MKTDNNNPTPEDRVTQLEERIRALEATANRRQKKIVDQAKVTGCKEKYRHLAAAARDCFPMPTLPETWAQADNFIRHRNFSQLQRDKCSAATSELDRFLTDEEMSFLQDCVQEDSKQPEEYPIGAGIYEKLSRWRLENVLADSDASELADADSINDAESPVEPEIKEEKEAVEVI